MEPSRDGRARAVSSSTERLAPTARSRKSFQLVPIRFLEFLFAPISKY
jgi:hypothetical protein